VLLNLEYAEHLQGNFVMSTKKATPAKKAAPKKAAPKKAAAAASADKAAPSAQETSLKNKSLTFQIQNFKLDARKKRRDEQSAKQLAPLDLRIKRANAEKAEIELEDTRRKSAIARAADVEHAEYMFYDGVNWDSVKAAIGDLNVLSRRHAGQPLTIVLNSPGGTVLPGLALYDHIRDLSARGHHITTKVRGMAASMGGILLQAGDTRVVGPEALVLIHEVSAGTIGKVSEMQDRVNFSKLLWDKLAKILARRSKMSAEEIQKATYKFDWWISAEEAVEKGFADQIG
jgi:ATP-dependent Clp endopeptidase proteolytic subunit ClpP